MSCMHPTRSIGLHGSSRRPAKAKQPAPFSGAGSRRGASVRRRQLAMPCQASAVASMTLTGVNTGAFLDESLEGTAAYNNIVPFPLPEQQQAAPLPGRAPSNVAAPAAPLRTASATATAVRLPRFAVGPAWGPAWIPAKLPGPTAADSSGLDFVDLFDMPLPEVMARVDDAATFRMLGCTQGALQRVPAAAGSPAQLAAPAPVNINALTRFRNSWIRNVSPVVAVSVRDAMIADRAEKKRKAQALLDAQKAACASLGASPSPPSSPPSPSSKTGGGGSVKCRFVSAAAAEPQQQQAALCSSGSSGSESAAEATTSAAPSSSSSPTSSEAAGGGAVGTNAMSAAEVEQQQAASAPSSTSTVSAAAPSCTADEELDASQLPQRSTSSRGDCGAGRRRGSRGRGLGGAGRQQGGQGGDSSWI